MIIVYLFEEIMILLLTKANVTSFRHFDNKRHRSTNPAVLLNLVSLGQRASGFYTAVLLISVVQKILLIFPKFSCIFAKLFGSFGDFKMDKVDVSSIRVPGGGEKVYKDQCMYCFDSPVSFSTLAIHFENFVKLKIISSQLFYTIDLIAIDFISWINRYFVLFVINLHSI